MDDDVQSNATPRVEPVVDTLTTAECWRLIEASRLGRLALVDPRGDPEVFPVNFTTHEGVFYIRTASDSKTRHIRSHPVVALEIDGEDGGAKWSVLVRGEAIGVSTTEEVRRSGVDTLQSDSPTTKPYVVRIDPRTVTGRRFVVSVKPAAAPRPLRQVIHTGDESGRPTPIPHARPFPQ